MWLREIAENYFKVSDLPLGDVSLPLKWKIFNIQLMLILVSFGGK